MVYRLLYSDGVDNESLASAERYFAQMDERTTAPKEPVGDVEDVDPMLIEPKPLTSREP